MLFIFLSSFIVRRRSISMTTVSILLVFVFAIFWVASWCPTSFFVRFFVVMMVMTAFRLLRVVASWSRSGGSGPRFSLIFFKLVGLYYLNYGNRGKGLKRLGIFAIAIFVAEGGCWIISSVVRVTWNRILGFLRLQWSHIWTVKYYRVLGYTRLLGLINL